MKNAKHFGKRGEVLEGQKQEPIYYHITPVGDLQDRFSYQKMFNGEVERKALLVHAGEKPEDAEKIIQWKNRVKSFYKHEYYYRSSMATVIQGELVRRLKENNLLEDGYCEAEMEHKRWNAYMRSEGYIYSGTNDPKTRNDLGKIHHDLCPFKQLDEAEQNKDEVVLNRKQ